ncbi:MAG TPA: pyridoxamine 5'-phosphate oxidase family protein [Actinomycetota bacterium]|nr:pyridoxamine 5'-phosphate oxidase family protein [Actinomycetota bacterium]
MTVPSSALEVLRSAALCYLGAPSPRGPHVTPVVYAVDRQRLWATISRGTVKAAAWRRTPQAAGMVRGPAGALTFRGRVTLYDALDPFTWPAVAFRAVQLARASARFTLRNARFFAGYARDARRVPLAWTPPGRIVVSVELDAGAVLEGTEVAEMWGPWEDGIAPAERFSASSTASFPDGRLPDGLDELLRPPTDAAVGVDGPSGPVVLPARWTRLGGTYLAAVARAGLELSGAGPRAVAALVIDRASAWRAAEMSGILLRGPADVVVPGRLGSGERSLASLLQGLAVQPGDAAVLRLRPHSAVWWKGWSSGTVDRP